MILQTLSTSVHYNRNMFVTTLKIQFLQNISHLLEINTVILIHNTATTTLNIETVVII